MVDAFGGSRLTVKPPERGVFALDHEGECKAHMLTYLSCLSDHKDDQHFCREHSKQYLACRMEKGLMKKEDLSTLGFGDNGEYERVQTDYGNSKEAKGFVAGAGIEKGKKVSKSWW